MVYLTVYHSVSITTNISKASFLELCTEIMQYSSRGTVAISVFQAALPLHAIVILVYTLSKSITSLLIKILNHCVPNFSMFT